MCTVFHMFLKIDKHVVLVSHKPSEIDYFLLYSDCRNLCYSAVALSKKVKCTCQDNYRAVLISMMKHSIPLPQNGVLRKCLSVIAPELEEPIVPSTGGPPSSTVASQER